MRVEQNLVASLSVSFLLVWNMICPAQNPSVDAGKTCYSMSIISIWSLDTLKVLTILQLHLEKLYKMFAQGCYSFLSSVKSLQDLTQNLKNNSPSTISA